MERIKSFQHFCNPPTNDEHIVSNHISEPFRSSRLPSNNRNASLISPTDQRMNALNDQQTAEAAATLLNTASSPTSSTSRTCNNYNVSSNQIRNLHQSGCDSQASTAEMTPLLYIQPANHTNNTSHNNNLPINRALLIDEENEEGSNNIEEGTDASNIMSNVIA